MLKRSSVPAGYLLLAFAFLLPFKAAKSRADLNPAAPLQAQALVINEYLADPPDGLAGDANGDGTRSASQDEFVELVNSGPEPLAIGGFTISDAAQVRFTFPAGTMVPAGEATVVFGGGRPTGAFGNAAANGLVFAVGGAGLSLNNGADSIIVKDNSGLEVARRDYPSADGNANQAITRSPDISGDFVLHTAARGSGGRLFSPGTQVNGAAFTTAPHITQIIPNQILESAT